LEFLPESGEDIRKRFTDLHAGEGTRHQPWQRLFTVPAVPDLSIMRRMDKLHLDSPFAGSRILRNLLAAEGFKVGRLHVATLMKRMGIEAIYRKPKMSNPTPETRAIPISYASGRSHGRTKCGRWTSPISP